MLKLQSVVVNRKGGTISGTITAQGKDGKYTIVLHDGTEKQYTESTLKKYFKVVEPQQVVTTPANATESTHPAPQQAADSKKVQLQEVQEEKPAQGKTAETKKVDKPAQDRKKPVEPAIKKMFDNMIAHMVDMGCEKKQTPQYMRLIVCKHNIAEVHLQKKGIKIDLNSQSLSAENIDLCKVVPDTYGWTLDCIYKVTDQQTYDKAAEMLEQGFNFRNKPVTTVKPADKKEEAPLSAK